MASWRITTLTANLVNVWVTTMYTLHAEFLNTTLGGGRTLPPTIIILKQRCRPLHMSKVSVGRVLGKANSLREVQEGLGLRIQG